jgi:hypothetical protein
VKNKFLLSYIKFRFPQMSCNARANVYSLIFYLSNSLSLLHKTVPFFKLKNFCSICSFVCMFICMFFSLFICYIACSFVSFFLSLVLSLTLRAWEHFQAIFSLSLHLSFSPFLSFSLFLSWRPQLQQQWSVRFKHRWCSPNFVKGTPL